jgi:glutamyl-Q tRNA(Asp) synthetase
MQNPSCPTQTPPSKPTYIGRFAPSPTGFLHFGSLVSALASYLDAHHHQGQWLVRMEDIDPPREQKGAAAAILQSLEDHGLHWHGAVLYQSLRLAVYADYSAALEARELVYPCVCTRQNLARMGGIYNGHCRTTPANIAQTHALRLKLYDLPASASALAGDERLSFTDLVQGTQTQNLRTHAGDQIIKRKDGLFAYQLAVVVDDIEQQISHIIRGSDLLDVTARQIFLFRLLQAPAPQFGHVTLATHSNGQKLSKQNLAPPLNPSKAGANIWHALAFLGQNPPRELYRAPPRELLAWGITHWQLARVKGLSAALE